MLPMDADEIAHISASLIGAIARPAPLGKRQASTTSSARS